MLYSIPENSITSMCRRLSELTGGKVTDKAGYQIFESGFSMFYSRHLITAGNDSQASEIVDSICQDIQSGGPRLISYTEEKVGPDFAAALNTNGFINIINQAGMMIDLNYYTPIRKEDPAIILISSSDLREWSRTCETAFGKPSELPALQWFIQDNQFKFYAYLIDGIIVGTALTYSQDGNCGIHEVGTLPEHRGRGICSSLITRILFDAKAEGNSIVSLQASVAGSGVYAKVGMKTVSTIKSWMKIE
jgi:predicted GNAT family acetyltransferase